VASVLAADFGLSLASQLGSDESLWALRPDDEARLDTACILMYARMEQSAPGGTLKQDKSHWRWWTRWCDTWNTPPMRTDHKANMGHDWAGARREAFLQAAALPWILSRMQPRGRQFPLPTSAMQVILGVRRIHRRLGYDTVPFRQVSSVLKSLLHEYCEIHGPESLLPHRKSPLPPEVVTGLIGLCKEAGVVIGSRVVHHSPFWVSMACLIAAMAQSGLRKAEISSQKSFTKKDMSRASLFWDIQGVTVRNPTRQQMLDLKVGDYACMTPPPAKADQFGVIYGSLPIYLPFHHSTLLCAAREFQSLELAFPVSGPRRRDTPLFTAGEDRPLKPSSLDTVLKHMLRLLVPADQVSAYSWHSFRITLACSLLKAGASGKQIQALCRWQSDRSLQIYARLGASDYGDLLDKANGVDISQVNISQLPALDEARLLSELHTNLSEHQEVLD
jgi:hypothetical protein